MLMIQSGVLWFKTMDLVSDCSLCGAVSWLVVCLFCCFLCLFFSDMKIFNLTHVNIT